MILPEEAYSRKATHTELGELTLLDQLNYFAEHAEGNLRQIQGVRAAYKEHRAKQAAS